jgi:hypothetical protein
MGPKSDDPVEFFAKPADFERWLRKHHANASCVWVKYEEEVRHRIDRLGPGR